MATDQSSTGDGNSNAFLTPESFGRWMATAGYTPKTVADRRAAMGALSRAWPEALSTAPEAFASHPGYKDALAAVAPWQAKEARSIPNLLAMMEDDARAAALAPEFMFYEVNPGSGAVGYAAAYVGGWSNGAEMADGLAREVQKGHHGSDIVGEPHGAYQVVLATLPFSAFATKGAGDPSVNEVLAVAARRASRARAVLFRIDWSAGHRMKLDHKAWERLVEKALPGFAVQSAVASNENFVPMKGHELFVAAARDFRSDFRLVGTKASPLAAEECIFDNLHPERLAVSLGLKGNVFPRFIAKRIEHDYRRDPRAAIVKTEKGGQRMLSPLEIMRVMGFRDTYHQYGDEEGIYELLGGSAPVPVAESAVRGLLRAAGLE